MSEPKPVWNVEIVPFSEPTAVFPVDEWRRLRNDAIAVAFGIPAEYFKPFTGTIQAEAERAFMAEIRQVEGLVADAFPPFIQAVNEHADTMARLALELEALRMKMIGRRYQAVFAVLVVVVYLIVEMVTR